ncbi:hypothetical protein [Enterovirga rhinocerotis]|uniref:DUF1236 domain-containing protein n=1 Tax=Enterovirga rhinocerotis TaxID=1339210 RepID=A0A4R7C8D7_9HYPH|nr:hypothetical protein [Enterovirga rhinocerotis]TDR94708.1 hypothetical protein EV668_1996 [Enterovirga rhinocerotis]
MNQVTKGAIVGGALLAAVGVTTAASAQQPLAVVVRPVAAVVQAPFTLLGLPATTGYNPEPARQAAVAYTSYDWAVVRPGVLKATGPHHINPANADYRRPIVLRRGSTVPAYVETAPVANISTPGMVRNATYDFFVSPQRHVVFVHPVTRQVVQITR